MKLALIGDPVEHSGSPRLHRRFMDESGIDGSYVTLRVPAGRVGAAIARLRDDGFTGCNVTYPLKEEAVSVCARLTGEARRANAVNTIFFGRDVAGTDTDGAGARSAIETLTDEPVALKRVGVLGYGATARAILAELQEHDAYAFVWGRDRAAASRVCERYEAQPWPFRNVPEIVVSALPPNAQLPPELIENLRSPDIVIDANYGARATLARQIGREVVGGEVMLEAQARASFDYWLAQLDAFSVS